jgi:hypothetical protein
LEECISTDCEIDNKLGVDGAKVMVRVKMWCKYNREVEIDAGMKQQL